MPGPQLNGETGIRRVMPTAGPNPNGPVGAALQTIANQAVSAPVALYGMTAGARFPTKKKRRKRKKTLRLRRTGPKRARKGRRLVKGSAAAKRFMARLRAKRRKK